MKEMWACPMCTFHNDGQTTRCTLCDYSEAGHPIKLDRQAHSRTAESFKFGHCSNAPKQAKAKRNAPSVRGPPDTDDTESCMKCTGVAYTLDNPIFFCDTKKWRSKKTRRIGDQLQFYRRFTKYSRDLSTKEFTLF